MSFSSFHSKMNATKPVKERAEYIYIGDGHHKLVCQLVEPYVSKTRGDSIRAVFTVLESDTYAKGTVVSKAWECSGLSKFPGGETDLDRFAYFVRKMIGAPDEYLALAEATAVGHDRVAEQLFRGMLIEATGTTKVSAAGKPWTTIWWKSTNQTQAEIAARRTQLDETNPLNTAQPTQLNMGPSVMQTPVPSPSAAPNPGQFLSGIPGFRK
jgi:hypothetical protein